MKTNNKRSKGQYYTVGNPFNLFPFVEWVDECRLSENVVIEPFAGDASIPKLIKSANIDVRDWVMFDIEPKSDKIHQSDTLSNFPSNYKICITNPPWLAKNSAKRQKIDFPEECRYDDLYKYALERCLTHCDWVAAIIPESYIRSDLFFDRLSDFVSLLGNTGQMFDDTQHPVGLALFIPDRTDSIRVWRDSELLGTYKKLKQFLPSYSNNKNIKFNESQGNIGLIAIDNTIEPSIRFCDASEIPDDYVSPQCRSKTRISADFVPNLDAYNRVLNQIRENTSDVFMTAFKGIRKDGLYRRRLDWALARSIIDSVNTNQTTFQL